MTKAVVLIGLLFAAACDVGEVTSGVTGGGIDAPIGGGGSDAGSGSGSGSGIQPNVAQPRSTNVQNAHLHTAGGGTNAGQNCMQAGACHAQGGGGPQFQIAGTLYDTAGTPDPGGATIEIQPGGAGPITGILTDKAGNFYIGPGEGNQIMNAFPAKTCATAAPKLTPMNAQVAANGGGACNSCHANPPTGGAPGVLTLQ